MEGEEQNIIEVIDIADESLPDSTVHEDGPEVPLRHFLPQILRGSPSYDSDSESMEVEVVDESD